MWFIRVSTCAIIYSIRRKRQNARSFIPSDPPAASITENAAIVKSLHQKLRKKICLYFSRKILDVNFSLIIEHAYKTQFSRQAEHLSFLRLDVLCTSVSIEARVPPFLPFLSVRLSRRKFGITSENASVSGSAHSEYNITPAARRKLFSYSDEPTSDFSCITKERAAPEAVCARETRGQISVWRSFV